MGAGSTAVPEAKAVALNYMQKWQADSRLDWLHSEVQDRLDQSIRLCLKEKQNTLMKNFNYRVFWYS